MVKTNSSILQDDVAIHDSNLESNPDFYYPLSSTYHDSLYHGTPNQLTPLAIFLHSLNF